MNEPYPYGTAITIKPNCQRHELKSASDEGHANRRMRMNKQTAPDPLLAYVRTCTARLMHQCSFCGAWYEIMPVRWDLQMARVCPKCDLTLGPDTGRVQSARLSPDLSQWLEDYLARYEP